MDLERLVDEVKNFLDVTWTDPATDAKYLALVRAGVTYLNGKAGEILGYETGSDGWTLLIEYVRYARDAALDVFEANYRSLILAMQHDRQLARMRSAAPDVSDSDTGEGTV